MKKIIICVLFLTLSSPFYSTAALAKSKNESNKSVCKSIKYKYKSETMSSWAQGLATDQDFLKEINFNIKMMTDKQKNTGKKIKVIIDNWIAAENKNKTALLDGNVKQVIDSINLKIKSITDFNNLCKSVGI